jgi:integrase/recombinase XerD
VGGDHPAPLQPADHRPAIAATTHRPVALRGPLAVGQAGGRQPGELVAQLLGRGRVAPKEPIQPFVDEHLDLRDFHAWCARISIGLLAVRRGHIEAYIRALEEAGRSRATVARRLATLAGFYRYAVQEGALPHSPATHIRRPSVARDSQTLGLDREEAVRFLATAQDASARDHALACLLTLNGLRVSEACAADVVDLGVERAHRVLAVVGKGGQRTLVPLAPRTVRAIDAALGDRTDGPLLVSNNGGRLDRHDAARIVARLARRAGLAKHITPHSLRHTMVTLALDAGVSLRDVQDAARHADPRTTRRYDRARHALDRHARSSPAASA